MTIRLPAGIQATPIRLSSNDELLGLRVVKYEYQILGGGSTENLLGLMQGVEPGGTLDWSASSAIKGGGNLTVTDRGTNYDWLNIRIMPIATLDTGATRPLGVFLPAAPVEKWNGTGKAWDVELLDKCSLLDQDIPTGANQAIITYSVPAGTNVIATIRSLIAMVGEKSPAIMDDATVLTSTMTWDLGTTILQVCNDLLEAIGFMSLWCDNTGQFRTEPYVTPKNRIPVYQNLKPLSYGDDSLMSPEWTNDRDIYSIPNRYVAVGQGDGDTEALISVATNLDPASPFSQPSRGRWVTRVVTGVEAAGQAALDTRAKMGLAQASSVTNGISVEHLFLPELAVNRTIAFSNGPAGLDLLCYVTSTTVTLDPTALCKSEIREAIV